MKNIKSFSPRKIAGSIEHENIKIRAKDEDGTVSISVRKLGVLSKKEVAAQLVISGEDFQFVVDLDSIQLDKLEGGLHKTQQHLMEQNV